MSAKVFVIGLDGATMDLIDPWVAEGRLPNLARLMRDGAAGRMRSVPNRNSAASWSSIATGRNPGKHGIFWFVEYKDDYSYVFVNASFRDGTTMWRQLSDAGHPVIVMNVPMTYPAEPVNGVLIAGVDGPGLHDPRFAYPATVVEELRREVGDYTVEVGMPAHVKGGRYAQALEETHQAIDQRLAAARWLMTSRPWEFSMVVFRETDPVQHFFWKFMQPESFQVSPEEIARFGNGIRDVYEHLDTAIGQLLEVVGENVNVLVVSDHGAGPDTGKARSLQRWLEALGLLSFQSASPNGQRKLRALALRTMLAGVHAVDKRISYRMKKRIAHTLPWLRRRTRVLMSYGNIDWTRTRAYSDGKRPDMWINLRGRQPLGQVEPGRGYDEICAFIKQKFTSARGRRDGRPVVRAVYRRDEAYHGPHVHKSPDLVVEWEKGAAPDAVVFDDGTVVGMRERIADPMEQLVCGGHEPDGILIMHGPDVQRGAAITGSTVVDVAPTVLYLLNEPIPDDVDGQVRREAIREDVLAARPVRVRPAEELVGARSGYNSTDEAEIRDRLRGLGYVE